MSPQPSSASMEKPPATFHMFARLPLELQFAVWRLFWAAEHRDVIHTFWPRGNERSHCRSSSVLRPCYFARPWVKGRSSSPAAVTKSARDHPRSSASPLWAVGSRSLLAAVAGPSIGPQRYRVPRHPSARPEVVWWDPHHDPVLLEWQASTGGGGAGPGGQTGWFQALPRDPAPAATDTDGHKEDLPVFGYDAVVARARHVMLRVDPRMGGGDGDGGDETNSAAAALLGEADAAALRALRSARSVDLVLQLAGGVAWHARSCPVHEAWRSNADAMWEGGLMRRARGEGAERGEGAGAGRTPPGARHGLFLTEPRLASSEEGEGVVIGRCGHCGGGPWEAEAKRVGELLGWARGVEKAVAAALADRPGGSTRRVRTSLLVDLTFAVDDEWYRKKCEGKVVDTHERKTTTYVEASTSLLLPRPLPEMPAQCKALCPDFGTSKRFVGFA